MAVLVRMLYQPASSGNVRFFGVYAARKMMPDFGINKTHDTSLPLTRILIALAALAIVEMYAVVGRIWPTSSGKVYVSEAARLLVLVIKFWLPGVSEPVTKLTLMVAVDALTLVAVNLSMITAVMLDGTMYCVV